MEEFLKSVPEAKKFCESIAANIGDYALFSGEKFEKIVNGVLAASNTDEQGEIFPKEELEKLEKDYRIDPMWLDVEHNPLIHPIGRVVAAKLFHDSSTGHHFIAGVIGYYGIDSYRKFADVSIDLETMPPESPPISEAISTGASMRLAINPFEIDDETCREILTTAPTYVDRETERRLRKSLDPITIATLVFIWPAGKFLEGFFSEPGKDLYQWLKAGLLKKLESSKSKVRLLGAELIHGETTLEYYVDSSDFFRVDEAFEKLQEAIGLAIAIVEKLRPARVFSVVALYSSSESKWQILYASTEHGVITDRPQAIDVSKYGGLSIAGSAGK